MLLLAQALIGALSLSALNRLVVDTTADRVEVVAPRRRQYREWPAPGQAAGTVFRPARHLA
ncbi:hypothetical protein WJ972_28875 [Achromobacter insuavis]